MVFISFISKGIQFQGTGWFRSPPTLFLSRLTSTFSAWEITVYTRDFIKKQERQGKIHLPLHSAKKVADHVCNHFKIDLIENRTLIYHCFQEAIDFPHFKFSINGSSTVYGIWIQKSPPFHEEDQHVESSLPLGSSKTLMQIENPFGRSYRCIISPKNNEKDPVLDAFIRSQITNLVQEHPTIGWSKTFQKID